MKPWVGGGGGGGGEGREVRKFRIAGNNLGLRWEGKRGGHGSVLLV